MIKKILVTSIILLFIGVGIQPALAFNSYTSNDDCKLCPKVSKQEPNCIRILTNKIKIINHKLPEYSKYHPEVKEKYQELSDKILILKEMNNRIKTDEPFPVLCDILLAIMLAFSLPMQFFLSLTTIFWNFDLIAIFFNLIAYIFLIPIGFVFFFLEIAGCDIPGPET